MTWETPDGEAVVYVSWATPDSEAVVHVSRATPEGETVHSMKEYEGVWHWLVNRSKGVTER